MRKSFALAVFSLYVALLSPNAGATTILVSSPPLDVPCTVISAALSGAHPKDIIVLPAGVYHENVVIPDTLNDIQLISNDGATIVGKMELGVDGIAIQATGVTVRGLTVINFDRGISTNLGGNTICSNTLIGNIIGIFCSTGTNEDTVGGVPPPQHTFIQSNMVTNSVYAGIMLDLCQHIVVARNITNFNPTGIYVTDASIHCKIEDNEAYMNTNNGIWIDFGHSNKFEDNTALGNGRFDIRDDTGGLNFWQHNTFFSVSGL